MRRRFWQGAAALLLATLLPASLVAAQTWVEDEEETTEYYHLHAYVGAWMVQGEEQCEYTGWEHDDKDSVGVGGYTTVMDTGSDPIEGGHTTVTALDPDGKPVDSVTAELMDLTGFRYCPT